MVPFVVKVHIGNASTQIVFVKEREGLVKYIRPLAPKAPRFLEQLMQATITRMVSQWRRSPRPLSDVLYKRHANMYTSYAPIEYIVKSTFVCVSNSLPRIYRRINSPIFSCQNFSSLVFRSHFPRFSLTNKQDYFFSSPPSIA